MAILPPPRSFSGRAPTPRRGGAAAPGRLDWKRFPGRLLRRPRSWKHRLLLVGLTVVLVGIIGAVGAVAWVSQDLPDPNKLNSRTIAQSTKIYARDGQTILYEIHGDQRRTLIALDDIGPYTKWATLSIEDKDFYKHRGVSLRGTLRAIFVDLLSGSRTQGGSTITQQLVKNAILTNEKSVARKMKEWVLAYQIERRFSKDQILKLYFNEIPYGSSAYGVEAAAQTYFNKSAKNLDLAESALLAAILPAPSYYSPTGNHPDLVVKRWKIVLDTMVKEGHLSRALAEETKKIDILQRVSPTRDRIAAPHFVFYVRDLLEEKYGTAQIERGGLRVVTTLDPDLQRIAEEEVAKGAERNAGRYNASNAALVAIEPKTGQLMAMVGSRDYFDAEHDGNFNVATAVRNPGSSFKPIVYLSAFMRGYTPNTMLFDLKTNFGPDGSGKDFSPNNYDFKEHGPLTMRQTLGGSLNIPAVKTLYLAGISNVIDNAEKLGYTTFDRSKLGLALAIGGGGVELIQHVSAFATLANDGVRNPVSPLLRVEDANGKVLELYKNKENRALPQQPVRQLNNVLSDNSARAFVFGSRSPLILPGRLVAAKTGTTNDFKDGWTMGYAPQLAAGVWVGNNDNSPMRSGSDGVVVAGPIWHEFMRRALEGDPVQNFPGPTSENASKPVLRGQLGDETPISVDSATGKQIPDSCLSTWPKQYVKQVIIHDVHTILYYVNRDDPRGAVPSDPTKDPMFARWEAPVQAWAQKNNYVAKRPAMEKCSLRISTSGLAVAITSPKANATISGATLPVTLSLSPNKNIASVKYSIDGTTLATAKKSPFNTTLSLAGVANGFRTLLVVVTNDDGDTASAETMINVVGDSSAATLYFISPSPGATVVQADFPKAIRVFVYDPAGVASVTLQIKNPDSSVSIVDAVTNPASSTVTLSWSTTPPGSYQLFFVLKNKNGGSAQSDLLPVTVSG